MTAQFNKNLLARINRELGADFDLNRWQHHAIYNSTQGRIEIYLMDSAGDILAKWSDNHAIAEKPVTILINSQERVEYNETIATRELTPNKVFIAEVFFPQYPELRIRQKFLAVP